MSRKTSLIPAGYTFLNHKTFVSHKGKDFFDDLVKQSHNRNPDAFNMYIYNDFYAYGLLGLVDKTLASVHTKITRKSYEDAFYLLEGLTHFNDCDGEWPMCDDGNRTRLTDKAYGALVVAVLKGLQTEGRLGKAQFPNLESFLRVTSEWADQMKGLNCDAEYGPYCKQLGEKLFAGKTAEEAASEKAWFDEWFSGLDEDHQDSLQEDIDDDEEEDEEEPGAWYAKPGNFDENNLVLSRVWKEYKAYLGTVPKRPMKGPSWDIGKWSAAQKKAFSFNDDGENSDDY